MKKLAITTVALAVCAGAVAAVPAKMTPAERRARIYRHTGGMIVRPVSGKFFRIVNAAGVPTETVALVSDSIHSGVFFRMVTTNQDLSTKAALDETTGFALFFVKNDGPRILVAPEDRWAQVNVAALASDDPKVFRERILKESWRAVVYAMGGGNSQFPQCVMKPMDSLADLDANTSLIASPEVFGNVTATARKFGLGVVQQTTYLRACQEGWAPAPTNDVQKAIWDKVHAVPTEPLKIKPETKKVRD